MPSKKRRSLCRPRGMRRYKRLFIISVEGHKTESQYFEIINTLQSDVHIKCLNHKSKNASPYVLKRIKEYLKKEKLKKMDEAWIVIDKDIWTDDQLIQIHEWSKEAENYGFALSNPKFEYWLLLHFEDGASIANSQQCTHQLKQHMPEYDKSVEVHKITQTNIDKAIQRAKIRDTPPCVDWPRTSGVTTVYRLVSNILKPL